MKLYKTTVVLYCQRNLFYLEGPKKDTYIFFEKKIFQIFQRNLRDIFFEKYTSDFLEKFGNLFFEKKILQIFFKNLRNLFWKKKQNKFS